MQTHFYLKYCLARFTMPKPIRPDSSTVPYLLFHIDISLVPETDRHHNNSSNRVPSTCLHSKQ